MSAATNSAETLPCPACGGANPADGVFCVHCGKALGPFRYVREELQSATTWYEAMADRVSDFIARPHFFVVHTLWFVLWVAANAGIVMTVRKFDEYPYNLLSILLAIEAIFITGFVLISQNRQQTLIEKAAELDYEVNVRAYREIQELQTLARETLSRLDAIETALQSHKEGNAQ